MSDASQHLTDAIAVSENGIIPQIDSALQPAVKSMKGLAITLKNTTDSDREKVNKIINNTDMRNDARLFAQLGNEIVTMDSMKRLAKNHKLNDEVINFFYKCLAERDNTLAQMNNDHRRNHFFRSHFFQALYPPNGEPTAANYCFDGVKTWTRRVHNRNIFKLDKIFFPCFVAGHWMCIIICMQERAIMFYDSLPVISQKDGCSFGYRYSKGLLRFLTDEWKKNHDSELPNLNQWNLTGRANHSSTRQLGNSNCGVYTCMYADLLSLRLPLNFNSNDVVTCWEQIALEIMKHEVPPETTTTKRRKRI